MSEKLPLGRVAKPFFKRPCTGHPNKAVFDGAIVEMAEKLFPSCADGPRRIGMDVFGDYLSRAMWSFEAIGAFGSLSSQYYNECKMICHSSSLFLVDNEIVRIRFPGKYLDWSFRIYCGQFARFASLFPEKSS